MTNLLTEAFQNWQNWAQKTSTRGLALDFIQSSCEEELMTIQSWPLLTQKPYNNPVWVSAKGDKIQLFHFICDHFIHSRVIYKINVVCIITLLFSHSHQASRHHYFQKYFLENLCCILQLLPVKTFTLFILRKDFSLWTFCSLPTSQLDSNILLNGQHPSHCVACFLRWGMQAHPLLSGESNHYLQLFFQNKEFHLWKSCISSPQRAGMHFKSVTPTEKTLFL